MRKHGYIYKHTNKLNGKTYVGQTWQDPDRRWRKSGINSYKNQQAFYNALKKYGWDTFESELIVAAFNELDLNYLEEYFINQYNSVVPNGYNLKSYSEGKETHSELTKSLISEKKKGKPVDSPAWNRTKHSLVDGIEYRTCTRCRKSFTLDNFHKYTQYTQTGKEYNNRYNYYCKKCALEYKKKYPYKRKDPEAVKESYKSRGKSSSITLKEKYSNDEARRNLSLTYKVTYKAIHIDTGKELSFQCGFDVNKAGFKLAGVCLVCNLSNKSYKGYRWTRTTQS